MRKLFPLPSARLTPGRACAVYALAFLLLLILDAQRFAAFLDRLGVDITPASSVAVAVRDVAEGTGLGALSQAEIQMLAACTPDALVGALGQTAKPPVESALAEFSGATPAHPGGKPAPSVPSGHVPSSSAPQPVPGTGTVDTAGPAVSSGGDTPAVAPVPTVALPTRPAVERPKVLLIGDSMMMEGFGPVLLRALRKRPDMEVIKEGKYSTGLSRQDYFDWPPYLETLIAQHDPDLVVICMGANDPQDIIEENKKRHHADSESWKTLYRMRAERLLAVATARGAKVVWAGLPVMGKEPYATRVRRLSELQQAACVPYAGTFVDMWPVLADTKGAYTTFKTDSQGKHVRLRYKDMVHVTEDGGAMLTEALVPAIEKTLGLGPYAGKVPGKTPNASGVPASPARPEAASGGVSGESAGSAGRGLAPSALPPGLSSGTPASVPLGASSSGLPANVPAGSGFGASPVSSLVPDAVAAEPAVVPFMVASRLRGKNVACTAFLPADRKPGERFPVLYLLHGAYESGEVWNRKMGDMLVGLAQRHRLVLIAPSCESTGWYADSPLVPGSRIESFLMTEVLTQVERTFPVLPRRGVMGMSMGGHGAFTLALRHPGVFASVSSMSGVLDITRHPTQWNISKVFGPLNTNKALWDAHSAHALITRASPAGAPAMLIATGQQDTAVLADNRAFQDALRKGRFVYQYREAPGKHDWTYWTAEMPHHVAFHAEMLRRTR